MTHHDEPDIAYLEEGMVVIRASALGNCSRDLWGALERVEPAAWPEHFGMETAAEEGKLHEEAMREKVVAEGWEFMPVPEGHDQHLVELDIIHNTLIIRGHVDGILTSQPARDPALRWSDTRVLWEAKSMSADAFKRWEAEGFRYKTGWAWQISAYMISTGLPCWLWVKNRSSGLITKRDIELPPMNLKEVTRKAMTVFRAFKNGEMPACDPERYPCQRFMLHDDKRDAVTMEDEGLEGIIEQHRTVKKELVDLEAREKALREQILTALPVGSTQIGQYAVSISESTRRSLDKDAVMGALGLTSLDEFMRDGKPFKTLRVLEGIMEDSDGAS